MSAPTTDILRAFRIAGEPIPLTGGEGRSFRVGEFVLKPVDEVKPHAWGAELLLGIRGRGFRVSAPVRAESGEFVGGIGIVDSVEKAILFNCNELPGYPARS
jgi:hypothetical protein